MKIASYILTVSSTENLNLIGYYILFFVGLILVLRNSILSLKKPNPNLLEFRKQPVYCWLLAFFIACFSLVFLISSWNATALRTLTCQHFINNLSSNLEIKQENSTNCQLISANFIGNIKSNIFISNLQEAKSEKRVPAVYRKDVPYEYKIVLLNNQERIPFTINWDDKLNEIPDSYRYIIKVEEGSGNDEQKFIGDKSLIENSEIIRSWLKLDNRIYVTLDEVIAQINNFISDITVEKIIIQDNLLLGAYVILPLDLFLGIISLLLVILSPKTLYKFSLEDNEFTKQTKILGREKTIHYALGDISEITLEKNDKNGRYRILLSLKSGEKMPLTGYYDSTTEEKQQIFADINLFLAGFVKNSPQN